MRHTAEKRFHDRTKSTRKLNILKNKQPNYIQELSVNTDKLNSVRGKLVKSNVNSIYAVKKKNRGLPHSVEKRMTESLKDLRKRYIV